MSADNGIYILKTPVSDFAAIKGDGFEYRVSYHSAVENYCWDDMHHCDSNDPNIQIINAQKMWKDCIVYHNLDDAMKEAARQYTEWCRDGMYLEYGISVIEIPKIFVG